MTRELINPVPTSPRKGYTLPVFACAAAIAALRWLRQDLNHLNAVTLNLVEPAEQTEIPIEQVARLSAHSALAIARSDPGDNLDLTRDTPVWALLTLEQNEPATADPVIELEGGEGIGRLVNADQKPAIYAYARRVLQENLLPLLSPGERLQVTVILPEGRSLALRTSNAAFGVVEGLSLLGSSGISQPLSAPGQLEEFRLELQQKAQQHSGLVFCVGENGLHLAAQMGMDPNCLVKTANWLGPLLVEAGIQGVQSILLFGYHGKLMKLAGGIFHTHHHVADGRQEIFAAHCANQGLATEHVQAVFAAATAEAGLNYLQKLDAETGSSWVEQVYGAIAQQAEQRSAAYIHAHTGRSVQVGALMFGRDRKIIHNSPIGSAILRQVLLS